MVRKAPKGFKNKAKGGKGKSLSKRAISDISKATRFAESIGSDKKFSDLAKEYKQTNVKYDRPVAFRANYGDETNKVGTPLASTYYKSPEGIERFFTAQSPTFRQLLGDIGRTFTGYNTLSFDPNAQGIATTTGGQIVRQPGLIESYGIPFVSTLMRGANFFRDLYNKGKDYFTRPSGIETVIPQAQGGIYEGQPIAIQQEQSFQSLIPGQISINELPPMNGIEQVLPSEMSNQQFQQTYPFLYPELQGTSSLDRQKSYLEQQDDYYYGNSPRISPTGSQYLYAKEGGSVDKYAGLGYKLK